MQNNCTIADVLCWGQSRPVTIWMTSWPTALLRAAPVIRNDLGINAHDLTAVTDSSLVFNAIFAMKLDEIGTMSAQSRAVHSAQWVRQSTLRQRTMDRNHIY